MTAKAASGRVTSFLHRSSAIEDLHKVDPLVKTEKRLLRCIISSCLLFIVLPK